jgi:hypothetical protein
MRGWGGGGTFPDEVGSEVWVYDVAEGDVEDERARSSV